MKSVYFDNAATTPLDPEVFKAMQPYMLEFFGNPSSIHSHGRNVRAIIETSRKTIANILNTSPLEILFTSGGTEADNTLLKCAAEAKEIKHAITSPLEHHAVLHTLENLEERGIVKLSMVEVDKNGSINLAHLDNLLAENPRSLVSLMHANNEIGNITDIKSVGEICHKHEALFHSDTVQTIGHYPIDLQEIPINYLAASAHKFHGPKGIGFMYINKKDKICPLIHGGSQELEMRGGTENVYGIIGLARALEIAVSKMDDHRKYIQGLKDYMIARLKEKITDVSFNGFSESPDKSLYTVLNVSLPENSQNDMLLFSMDLNGISVSGGSACSSGAAKGSHVLSALGHPKERGAIRFSFSKYNTREEVDYAVDQLADFYVTEQA